MKNLKAYVSREVSKTIGLLNNQVHYLRYDSNTVKNKYGESKRKDYHDSIPFNAILRFNPSKEHLEEFGMDKEVTEVLVKIPKMDLDEVNIKPSTDDVIMIKEVHYFITSLNGKGWSEGDTALTVIGCSRRSDNRAKK